MQDKRKADADSTFHLQVRTNASAISGRSLYTQEEDQAIKQYVDKFLEVSVVACSLAGNKLWQEMEEKKITNRSWMSMRDRYLKHIRQKPDSTVKPPEHEPDSSGSGFGPSRKRQLKLAEVTSTYDDNCPSSSTHKYQSRRTFSRSDYPSNEDIPSSTSDESLKRPEPSLLLRKQKEKAKLDPAVEIRASGTDGMISSEDDKDKLSEFDEQILKLAESDSDSETEGTIDETETHHSNSGMKAVMDCLSPDQIAVLESVRVLRCRRRATLAEIFYGLFCTSASLQDAMTYMEDGDVENVWTFEDDQILLSTDEQAIKELIESRGIQEVENRISFLEASPDSDVDA